MTAVGAALARLARRRCRRADGYFAPIGSNGFYGAATAAARVRSAAGRGLRDGLGLPRRAPDHRRRALGRTRARAPSTGSSGRTSCSSRSTTPTTGGCRDGLHADRVNENQGAESTLSFLLALVRDALGRSALIAPTGSTGRPGMIMTRTSRITRRSSTATPANPDPDGGRLAVSGAHRLQRRRDAPRRRHDAAALPRRGSPRPLAPVRGALGQRRRRLGHRSRSRRCGPIPSTIPRSCGGSRIRASRSSTSSASTPSPTPRSARAGPASRSR